MKLTFFATRADELKLFKSYLKCESTITVLFDADEVAHATKLQETIICTCKNFSGFRVNDRKDYSKYFSYFYANNTLVIVPKKGFRVSLFL